MKAPRNEPESAAGPTPLPRGFAFAAAWLGFGFLCAVWPLTRAFSGYTGILVEAPAFVAATGLGVFVALVVVYIQLLRLRPGGIWLSVSMAAIFGVSGLLRMPALVSNGGGPGVIWVVGISSMLHLAAAVYLSRPPVLAALERRGLEHSRERVS